MKLFLRTYHRKYIVQRNGRKKKGRKKKGRKKKGKDLCGLKTDYTDASVVFVERFAAVDNIASEVASAVVVVVVAVVESVVGRECYCQGRRRWEVFFVFHECLARLCL
jgi:hypothetical protein